MNDELLTTALGQHDPDPDSVMAAFRAKRRHRTRTRGLAVTGIAAVAVIAVTAVLQPWSTPKTAAKPQVADGCATIPLRETLASARQGGASIIVANSSLTGKTKSDGDIYYQVKLRSVQTLSGPAVTASKTAWIDSGRGPAGPVAGSDAGPLWATDGRLFAIAWPAHTAGTTVGPVLRIAPVVGSQVIFSSAGCWDTGNLPTQPFHGQLAEIPGSKSYAHAARYGFHAVPLSTVEQLSAG